MDVQGDCFNNVVRLDEAKVKNFSNSFLFLFPASLLHPGLSEGRDELSAI